MPTYLHTPVEMIDKAKSKFLCIEIEVDACMVGTILLRRHRQFTAIHRCQCIRHSSGSHFTPRSSFPLPQNNPFTWFPGHMLAGLRALSSTITDIDLIIETRDARIPLSSRNPYLEDVCAHKHRFVLYNKRDLAGLSYAQEQVRLGGGLTDVLEDHWMA
jgi:hypothetical protein